MTQEITLPGISLPTITATPVQSTITVLPLDTSVLPVEATIMPVEASLPEGFWQPSFEETVGVGECRNIRSVAVPKEMETNITMGLEKMDILMAGDGCTPSTACLLTGTPGSGKSTLGVQLADSITGTGNIALYNSCEESMMQLSRVAKRLKLENGFCVSAHRSVFDIIAHAKKIQGANPGKQVFLFVDSLQTIEMPSFDYDAHGEVLYDDNGLPKKKKGRPLGGYSIQVEATKLLTNWCKQTYGIMFLIGQVNKDGDFAGRQAIKHWVDAHLHLDLVTDHRNPDHGMRMAEMTKNRFGIAGIYQPFELTARGIGFRESKQAKSR